MCVCVCVCVVGVGAGRAEEMCVGGWVACVCVCVRERERERECEKERKREKEREIERERERESGAEEREYIFQKAACTRERGRVSSLSCCFMCPPFVPAYFKRLLSICKVHPNCTPPFLHTFFASGC